MCGAFSVVGLAALLLLGGYLVYRAVKLFCDLCNWGADVDEAARVVRGLQGRFAAADDYGGFMTVNGTNHGALKMRLNALEDWSRVLRANNLPPMGIDGESHQELEGRLDNLEQFELEVRKKDKRFR